MPLTRRQIYRRRRMMVFGGLFALLAGLTYLPLTLLAPVTETAAAVTAPQFEATAPATTALPGYGASAIAAVGREGTLAQAGSTDALPMASIAKVITALTVLDAHPLALGEPGPSITMTSADVAFRNAYVAQNGSVAPVSAGWVFSERELLEIMLIDSANNYAKTLITWAFGSDDAYLSAARAWLDAHDFGAVTVVDSSGLDPRSTASAADIVRLGEIALADPVVAEIVGVRTTSIHDIGEVKNTNALIGTAGVDGIKTGTLDTFGANLLFSSSIEVGGETIELVGVVLGGPDHRTINAAIADMIAQVQAGYRVVPLIAEDEIVASYTTPWDTEVSAVAASSASVVVWGDTPITVEVDTASVRLAEDDTEVGTITFTAGAQTVSVPLVLSGAIEDPGPWWRLGNPGLIFGMAD